MNSVPTGSVVAIPSVDGQLDASLPNSQVYSNITASGSSRVHNGNVIHVTYNSFIGQSCPQAQDGNTCQNAADEQLTRLSLKRKRPVNDVGNAFPNNREQQSLASVLESLGGYSKSMQQQKEGGEGRKIAKQLMSILELLEQAGKDGDLAGDIDDQVHELKHQLRRAKHIKINQAMFRSRLHRPHKAVSKTASVAFGHWTISLKTKTLHLRGIGEHDHVETCSALRVHRAPGSHGPTITAHFGEATDFEKTCIMHPILLADNQVRNDAEVFRLVKRDNLDGLMRLLAIGGASTRDCDGEARSLLYVSLRAETPRKN